MFQNNVAVAREAWHEKTLQTSLKLHEIFENRVSETTQPKNDTNI